ncbi:MAG: BTAD domain-containing putative transcriptional regulator [Candidatus Baltobacteraceae bacterium]
MIQARSADRLLLLGTPVVQNGGSAIPLALPPRGHTLLALLALRSERPMARSKLAATLWPDIPDEEARANLRRHLHLIARTLPQGSEALLLTKTSAQWNPEARISCDVVEFVHAAGSPGERNVAAHLYAGELCAGISDEPLEALRRELNALHDTVLRGLAEAALHSGDNATAVLALHRLVQSDPLDETSACRLILARLEAGDRAGALREYYSLVARLRADLGVDPQPETTALLEQVLASQTQSKTRHNLVTPSSSMVGRGSELRSVLEGLQDTRFVTLVGSPGIGKTRLAMEAAWIALGRFAAGVFLVELARDQNAASAFERIARTLNVSPADDVVGALVEALDQNPVLLVLDNLEQLGADANIVVSALIERTAVRILATSRRRIGGASECIIALGALNLPPVEPTSPKALLAYPAVRMFLERASKVAPHVRLTYANSRSVISIVRRLDGIPLAIELVASRCNLLTIDGIAKRLGEYGVFAGANREDRHRTIDAAVSWSYDLLSPVEQAVLRRVAVFADSCTVEALEEVCAPIAPDCVSPISELVESSLLSASATPDSIRYHTFEMTRAFAGERLRELDEYRDAACRHAHHYARYAESLYDDFTTDAEQHAFALCDIENGNFEMALSWSLKSDPVLASRLLAALWRFWIFRGKAGVGETYVASLEREGILERLTLMQRARFLQAAGMFARETRLGHARPYLERSLALYRECSNPRGEIEVLTAIAAFSFTRGRHEEAEQQFEHCLTLQESVGDRRGAAGTLANLAQLAWVRGDCTQALSILERALERFTQTKNVRGVAHVFRTRSAIFGTLERWDDAIAQAEESVLLYEALGEPARVGETLENLSEQNAFAGRLGESFAVMCRALETLLELHHGPFLCSALRGLHFAAGRVQEYEDVLRIDSVLRRLAARVGQDADTFDGTTQHTLTLARAALSEATRDAVLQSAGALDENDMLAIAERMRERHAGVVIEPFNAACIGRTSDA